MTFKFLSIFHDFPGKFIFPGFSMIFHDRGTLAGDTCHDVAKYLQLRLTAYQLPYFS